jgi:hypothetical protein
MTMTLTAKLRNWWLSAKASGESQEKLWKSQLRMNE